ncbi:energy transducer TonB [Hymenobacter nivis]|uniref:Energy transducer TonB n=1 Tax=Hymenobacter nivis TaxID=1850093 RepID=A0A502GWW5_9BACT|nr:energy transducer TonB [Hymenobacter nivis]TPG65476.1 energy transducer TonB [Hymenobacter nivis]
MMNNAQLATASLDDIVFDGRNRTYGAYVLRHIYQRNVTRALGIALALLALLVGGQALARLIRGPEVIAPFVPKGIGNPEVKPMKVDPIVLPPPAVAAVQPKTVAINSTKFDNIKIVHNNVVTEDIPEQEVLASTHVAAMTIKDGIEEGSLKELESTLGPNTATSETVSDKPYLSVEQMPELPSGGGQAGIVAAIQKLARYPTQALSAGVEGKVFASFVVNAQGEVTDLKIVKGLGSGLDEETLRAISKLPRFIPGRQNGRAVSVQYTVPISFHLDK